MSSKAIVCAACSTAVPYGRLSCPSCGELLASVVGAPRRAGAAVATGATVVTGGAVATSAPVATKRAVPSDPRQTPDVMPGRRVLDDVAEPSV